MLLLLNFASKVKHQYLVKQTKVLMLNHDMYIMSLHNELVGVLVFKWFYGTLVSLLVLINFVYK